MVLGRLGLLLALVIGGHLARRAGLLGEVWTGRLNAFAFYLALPALVFVSTHDRRPAELASPALVAGVWAVVFVGAGLAYVVHRRAEPPARRSVATAQSYHSNFGYVGLPIVSTAFGAAAAAQGSVVLGVGTLAQLPLTIAILVRMNEAEAAVGRHARALATNPILLALAVAIVVAAAGYAPPTPVISGLDLLAITALPAALLGVGASLERAGGADLALLPGVLGVKLIAMPAMAFLALTILGVGPVGVAAGVVMLGAPSAVATYIYASELGGDPGLASTNVFVTTLVGLATMSALILLLE